MEYLRKQGLVGVKKRAVVALVAIHVAIFSRQQGSTAGTADGIGHETVRKQRALFCQSIEARGFDQFIAVSANALVGVVVGEDENNVGLLGRGLRLGKQRRQE